MNSDQNSETLRQWKTFANETGPYDFFARVLTERRKAMVARLGTEAEDATNAFLDQALAYEQEHGRSLAGFLHWFMSSETSIKREMEKGTGEVRLMTVHGAKGLEANIVFLPDAANITGSNKTTSKLLRVPDEVPGAGLPFWKLGGLTKSPTQVEWEEAEQRKINAERYRLLYVAMTRACDELYVCGSKNEREIPKDCWYETIVNALGPANDDGQLRFGPEYTYIDGQAIKQEQRDVLPDWLAQPPAVESGTRIHSLTGLVSRHVSATKSYDALAARRGIAIHALLQDLPEIEKDKREAFARRKAIRLGLDEAEAAKLAHLINAPELTPFFGSESHAEAELRGRLDEGRIVSGRVDRIAILATEILLLDYKSDHFVPESVAVDHPYTKQLALYAELLKSAYPDRKVRAALFWTQGAKLEWIPPAYLTQARDQAVAELEPEAS
jgi:ATP-dependent helicase/nuclease subunit A